MSTFHLYFDLSISLEYLFTWTFLLEDIYLSSSHVNFTFALYLGISLLEHFYLRTFTWAVHMSALHLHFTWAFLYLSTFTWEHLLEQATYQLYICILLEHFFIWVLLLEKNIWAVHQLYFSILLEHFTWAFLYLSTCIWGHYMACKYSAWMLEYCMSPCSVLSMSFFLTWIPNDSIEPHAWSIKHDAFLDHMM